MRLQVISPPTRFTAANYTLVGDDGTFLQGLAVAAGWLSGGDAKDAS